jgi:ADP-ribose pyrophosphatase
MKQFTRVEPTTVQEVGEKFKREIVVKHFTTEDGLQHEFTTFFAEGTRAGAVIALTKDRQVITCYQFRGGPERWMYDLPGGGIHDGEDPQLGIARELQEETGYIAGEMEFLGTSTIDAYTNLTGYYYLATNCELSPEGTAFDDTERDQGVETRLISIDELIDYAKHDQMTDPHAVLMAYETLLKLKEA